MFMKNRHLCLVINAIKKCIAVLIHNLGHKDLKRQQNYTEKIQAICWSYWNNMLAETKRCQCVKLNDNKFALARYIM